MSETDPLQGGRRTIKHTLNIEYLRAFGLTAGVLMIGIGRVVSNLFNDFPIIEDGSKNSAWDILFNGKPTNFHVNETYIQYLFHFIHTCTYIDNNPGKTVAAVLIQVSVIPLSIFCYLNYKRIMLQVGPQFEAMKKRAFMVMIFEVICCSYFFLCLVNSPMQDQSRYETHRASVRFAMHYFPYMMFQTFEFIAAMEQVNFLYLQDKMPVPYVTKGMLNVFFIFFGILYVVYFTFMWRHIIWGPGSYIWDGATPFGEFMTRFIMIAYLTCGAVIPSIAAFFEAPQVAPMVIEFSLGPSPS